MDYAFTVLIFILLPAFAVVWAIRAHHKENEDWKERERRRYSAASMPTKATERPQTETRMRGPETRPYSAEETPALSSGKTPLMHWAAIGDENKVQTLLDGGADVRAVDSDGDGVLRYAMAKRNIRLFELLLNRGADPNARSTSAAGVPGFTIMHALAESGWSEGIEALGRHGANAESKGVGEITPMMLAAGGGRDDAVTALRSLGASVNARDNEGDSVLYYAVSKGHWSTTKLLLALGANPNPPEAAPGRNPITMAAALAGPASRRPPGSSVGDFEKVVVELLRAGADPSPMYDSGYALQRVVDGGIEIAPVDRVRQLVAAHNNWSVIYLTPEGRSKLNSNSTPRAQEGPAATRARIMREYASLDTAREQQQAYASRSLIGEFVSQMGQYGLHGADTAAEVQFCLRDGAPIDGAALINYGDDVQHWETPLLTALVDERLEVAHALIRAGANVDAPNAAIFPNGGGFGHTALHALIQRKDRRGVQTLIAAGADVNRQTTVGSTPLYFAASIDDPDLVRILLDAGAQPQIPDLTGTLPLDAAGPRTRHLLTNNYNNRLQMKRVTW